MLLHIQPARKAMRVARGERGVHAASLWMTMLVALIALMGPLVPWGGSALGLIVSGVLVGPVGDGGTALLRGCSLMDGEAPS